MKKIFFFVIASLYFLSNIFISFLSLPVTKGYFNAQYLRITDTTTPFFSSITDGEALFYLPYTYYVKLISKGEIFDHVEYGGADGITLDGYVPNQTLFDETLEVINPYPSITITTLKTTLLYADSSLSKSIKYIFKERQLTYYGSFILPDGTHCFYVSYGEELGYVKESDVSPFTISNHPNPLTFIPEETPPVEEPIIESNETVNTLRIIIIASLILAGLSGLVVVIKKRPNIPVNNYYDENDYE